VKKASYPRTRHTRRWPASLAVLAVLVLQLLVPAQINALPRWLMPALGFLLLLPLVWMNPFHLRRDEPWLRWVELTLLGVLVAVNAFYLAGMIFFLNGITLNISHGFPVETPGGHTFFRFFGGLQQHLVEAVTGKTRAAKR